MQKKLDVKSIPYLVDKEIKGTFKTINLTYEPIQKTKRHGSELTDGEKIVYAHEGIIILVIMRKFKFKFVI